MDCSYAILGVASKPVIFCAFLYLCRSSLLINQKYISCKADFGSLSIWDKLTVLKVTPNFQKISFYQITMLER
jgi:hypothetical protein